MNLSTFTPRGDINRRRSDNTPATKTILFVCSGNYYRSRFAEALFSYRAAGLGLNWRAVSRGLAIHRVRKRGKLSAFTIAALAVRGIPRRFTSKHPVALRRLDLKRASLVVAMNEGEHCPLLQEHSVSVRRKLICWQVEDFPPLPPHLAFSKIEFAMEALLAEMVSASNSALAETSPP